MAERHRAGEFAVTVSNSLFTDTITLYCKNGEQYERHVLTGVQWRQKIERLNDDGKLTLATVTSVTVPGEIAAPIKPGDVMVLGTGPKLAADYSIAKLKADFDTYCTVRAVADNTRRPQLKHRKVMAV